MWSEWRAEKQKGREQRVTPGCQMMYDDSPHAPYEVFWLFDDGHYAMLYRRRRKYSDAVTRLRRLRYFDNAITLSPWSLHLDRWVSYKLAAQNLIRESRCVV